MTDRKRRALWIAGIIIAFILGFLLGRRYCRLNGDATSAAGQVVGMGGGNGGGAHEHITPGSGGGKISGGPANGNSGADTDTVGTPPANGNSGDVDVGGGHDKGSGDPALGDKLDSLSKQVDTLSPGFVARLTGNLVMNGTASTSAPPDPRVRTKTIDDFSLDATQLPRYPMDVTKAYSGISTRSDKPADTGTAAVFKTTDSYDSVTSWYRSHMPPGAHETNADVNQLRALANQLTPKNILKMLGAQSPQQAKDTATPPPTPRDTAGQGSRMDGWQVPDDGVHGQRQVMVISSPGKPTTVMVSRVRQ